MPRLARLHRQTRARNEARSVRAGLEPGHGAPPLLSKRRLSRRAEWRGRVLQGGSPDILNDAPRRQREDPLSRRQAAGTGGVARISTKSLFTFLKGTRRFQLLGELARVRLGCHSKGLGEAYLK